MSMKTRKTKRKPQPAVASSDLVSRVPCPGCGRLITLHNDSTFHWHGKVGKHCPMSGRNIWHDLPERDGRKVLRGYIVPVFNWDHGYPERLFMPTLTRVPVNPSDRRCTITVEWDTTPSANDRGQAQRPEAPPGHERNEQ